MAGTLISIASANASFFDRSYQPRGITISAGQVWSPAISQQTSPLLACDVVFHCHIELKPPLEQLPGWVNVVAGTPWLLDRGLRRTLQDDAECKSLCETLHPRTAVGLDRTGRFLYVVTVEGRSPPVRGLSLASLSGVMADLGAYDALNLDGGGSSALFLDGKSVMKRPDNEPEQRKIANAIHIFLR
jgi:exopolysaccharide biosynthesis protein